MAENTKHCGTCKYGYLGPGYEPCKSCGDDCSSWEVGLEIVAVEERREEPEKYTYFVLYTFINKSGQNGIGNCFIDRKAKVRTREDVKAMESLIQDDNEYAGACIVNWKELEG